MKPGSRDVCGEGGGSYGSRGGGNGRLVVGGTHSSFFSQDSVFK